MWAKPVSSRCTVSRVNNVRQNLSAKSSKKKAASLEEGFNDIKGSTRTPVHGLTGCIILTGALELSSGIAFKKSDSLKTGDWGNIFAPAERHGQPFHFKSVNLSLWKSISNCFFSKQSLP